MIMRIERIELVYGTAGRFHTVTSPDVKGLYATGETREEAQREALALIQKIHEVRGRKTEMLTALEYEDADHQAA
jgi:predicted RNase H-like HicB family nuclease